MKELKDIVLKKGDMVEFETGYICILNKDNYSKLEMECVNRDYGDIIKVERPVKYEIIYETPKQILDKEEKEYLENVIRPFRDRVESIMKFSSWCEGLEAISIQVRENNITELPTFAKNTMYKGMELNKEYTLKELELFE